ncbi:hypothetical protein TNCV_3427901 [Trichonephila clavipes]|nr:hypothetical protein TNCV_3427901 [Trichonephila clavipes]
MIAESSASFTVEFVHIQCKVHVQEILIITKTMHVKGIFRSVSYRMSLLQTISFEEFAIKERKEDLTTRIKLQSSFKQFPTYMVMVAKSLRIRDQRCFYRIVDMSTVKLKAHLLVRYM